VIVLQAGNLFVRVDPAHGGEILDLVDVRTGAQYLGRPPFASLPPRDGELDEDTWTDRYRGGWQTVAPNAGNACAVGGVDHGFHGRASVASWRVADAASGAVTLAWEGHGLAASRRLVVEDGGLAVETTWRAIAAPAAMIWVEHITVGVQLLSPEVEIRLPGGRGFELSEVDGPAHPPDAAPGWPGVLLLDGSVERVDRWSLERPRARFCCVADLPDGRFEVRQASTGEGLAVAWDVDVLPHLWMWHEVRTSGGRWRGQAEMLGLEPASVPHSLGLARALAEGQAHVVKPGADLTCRIVVRPLDGGSSP
jgi:hypothetical protein